MFTVTIVFLIAGFIFWRLDRSNMVLAENVEKPLGARQSLHFAIDNGLPIK